MDEGNQALVTRLEELERERDELKKDLEQLCLHQSGTSLLGVATRLHLQRTAGLEQEISMLRNKFAALTREKQNLHEELSEAYRIKGQLADLYNAEVSKNMEIEKQVKFFQGCIAAAFAERDHALMESEKAKEHEEAILQELKISRDRIQEIESTCEDLWRDNSGLQIELVAIKEKISPFEKVVSKFFDIRQVVTGHTCDDWDERCTCLLNDPDEMWSFDEGKNSSSSLYIASLEEKLTAMKLSVKNLQSKIRVGLEIEHHLNRKAKSLEQKIACSYDIARDGVLKLRKFHAEIRYEIIKMMQEGGDEFKTMLMNLRDKMSSSAEVPNNNRSLDDKLSETEHDASGKEHEDISVLQGNGSTVIATGVGVGGSNSNAQFDVDTSNAFALALQEKVDALMLLSQQEERHLLERDLNEALQLKIGELQNNLFQVAHEKVTALLQLADVKQKLLQQQQNCKCDMKNGLGLAESSNRDVSSQIRDGRLKDILKKTYLGRWIGKSVTGNDVSFPPDSKENVSEVTEKCSLHTTRSTAGTATLQESIISLEHLSSSMHGLHLSLLEVRHDVTPLMGNKILDLLDGVILEADRVKTGLDTSLPLSSSTVPGENYITSDDKLNESMGLQTLTDKPYICAFVFEMAELLILLASLLKDVARLRSDDIEAEPELKPDACV